ncbi:MAG: phospholipase [Sphingobacteriales bacterium]|nr:MAG: phospholipase [Sphingobacteriales bacterium]
MPTAQTTSDYTHRNRVALIHGGREYFDAVVQLIRRATTHIHLQTYIYDEDETGKMVADELIAAALRGVKVYVIVDGYASSNLSDAFIQHLEFSGIHFRYFEPVLRSRHFYVGRRLHHKIIVADGRESLVGGINISDKYNDLPDDPAWLDWAMWAEGEVSYELFKVCVGFWCRSRKATRAMITAYPTPIFPSTWNCAVKVRRNDWVRRKNQISRSYIEMFDRAEEHIIVMSSYFLPGRVIRRNIAKARSRGVKISLILAGSSDVMIAKYAERFIYRWLLRLGVEIYEYPKAVLHAKLSTYDRVWVTVGSYNVNDISAYASIELNLDVMDDAFAIQADGWLQRIIEEDCDAITTAQLQKYNTLTRFLQWWSYEIYRALFFLFTFYFRQEKEN